MSCRKKQEEFNKASMNKQLQSDKKENYQMTSICDNQDDFNEAVYEALQYTNDQLKVSTHWGWIGSVIILIFFIWALTLAIKMPAGARRVEHIMFAMLFSPMYVLAYYIAPLGSEGGAHGSKSVNFGFA